MAVQVEMEFVVVDQMAEMEKLLLFPILDGEHHLAKAKVEQLVILVNLLELFMLVVEEEWDGQAALGEVETVVIMPLCQILLHILQIAQQAVLLVQAEEVAVVKEIPKYQVAPAVLVYVLLDGVGSNSHSFLLFIMRVPQRLLYQRV